jgi:hypothetical protein
MCNVLSITLAFITTGFLPVSSLLPRPAGDGTSISRTLILTKHIFDNCPHPNTELKIPVRYPALVIDAID